MSCGSRWSKGAAVWPAVVVVLVVVSCGPGKKPTRPATGPHFKSTETSSANDSNLTANSDVAEQPKANGKKPAGSPAKGRREDELFPTRKSGWTELSKGDRARADSIANDYIVHLNRGKTPRRFVAELAAIASENGAKRLEQSATNATGFSYRIERGGDAVVFLREGARPVKDGLQIVVVSADAARLELKQSATFERRGFGMLQTKLHGKLSWRSWMVHPIALDIYFQGDSRASRSGTAIVVGGDGNDPNEPVLSIPDLLPHLSRGSQPRGNEVDDPERLDPIGAMTPAALSKRLTALGIRPRDLAIAEAYLVPAEPARRIGVDRALIGGYGQKNRAAAFAAVTALATASAPERASVVIVLGRTETSDGARSGTAYVGRALRDVVSLLSREKSPDTYSVQQALSRSSALIASSTESGRNRGVALNLAAADALPVASRRVARIFKQAGVQFHWESSKQTKRGRQIATLDLDTLHFSIPSSGRGVPGQTISILDLLQGTKACIAWFQAQG